MTSRNSLYLTHVCRCISDLYSYISHWMYVPRLCYMRRTACAPHSLISTLVSRTKHLTFCRARAEPKLSAKLVCHILFGEGVPPTAHPGSGTANGISRRQRDRVFGSQTCLRSKKPTIRPRVIVVLRLG